MRSSALLLLAGLAFGVLAACGGGSPAGSGEPAASVGSATTVVTGGEAPAGSIGALLDADPAEDIALVLGSSDFAVGSNRVSFLLIRSDGQPVGGSTATVAVARGGLEAVPSGEGRAENLSVGVAADDLDVAEVWVASLELGAPGTYTLLVEPDGGEVQAVGQIEVAERSSAPAVGAEAIPSDTPTLEDGFAEDLTTARPPDVELLRHSVRQSLDEGVPFVVTFATPKYCASRVCGPVVEVVDEVRRRHEGSGIRFIHVEIYQGNDPSRGFNRWVGEWSLPTEPWTFLVSESGMIVARFEGLLTVGELDEAVREHLS